jgi:two-component system nitrate/nitrite sensor histidine kinase NarX
MVESFRQRCKYLLGKVNHSIAGVTKEARCTPGPDRSGPSLGSAIKSTPGREPLEVAEGQVQVSGAGKVLRAAAVVSLVAAILLAILLALSTVPRSAQDTIRSPWGVAHGLVWVQVGLMILVLVLALAAWVVHWAEDRFAARVARRVNQTLAAQSRRLDAFREIAAAGGQSLDLREVLELGLEKVLQVTGQEAAEIHLLDPDERTMALKAFFGEPEGFLMREEVIVLGECLCGLAVLNDEPVIVPDTQHDPRVTRLSCRRFGFQSAACVPLRVKGRAIGVLTVHGREKRHFEAEDTELLVTVANQLATAIENARFYAEMEARVKALSRELQHLAVVEERERLSREMHDGLAQTLSLLSMQVGQARMLLSSDDVGGAAAELREMSQVIDAGYEEVREAITNLRLTAPKGVDWVDWLQEYLYEFGLRHDLATELHIPSDRASLILPPHQEVHFTRIIQEALTNVRKHAQATQVRMALVPNGRRLTLRIEDNGRGFDVDRARGRRGRYGLSTLQERAALLGGSAQITSAPGHGTTVTVEIESEAIAREAG